MREIIQQVLPLVVGHQYQLKVILVVMLLVVAVVLVQQDHLVMELLVVMDYVV